MTLKMENEAQLNYLALLRESGCKFLFRTVMYGKTYVWVKDRAGNLFLERIPELPASGEVVSPVSFR